MTKYLGNKTPFEGLDVVVVENAPDSVRLHSDEVSALCPVTGQPDWYEVEIYYYPYAGRILETKSLKMYFETFRSKGIFAEQLATVVCEEITSVLKPVEIDVVVRQKARGGITIVAKKSKYYGYVGEEHE